MTNDLVPWNSMEYSMELWCRQMKYQLFPWNSMKYSMELWCRQMKYQLVPWNSMGYSMECHGTLVPPNDISLSSMEFHGTFHGTLVPPNEVSLSSMELWDCHFMTCYPGLSRNIPQNSTEFCSRQIKNHKETPSSMGFHGIRRAPLQMTQVFHGIPCNIPWNSMECSMEFHGTEWYVIWRHQRSMEFHGIFHGIPWN